MPELTNARHDLFAVLVAQARGSLGECYAKAGYKTKTVRAAEVAGSRLMSNVDVQNRVAELRAPAIQAAGIDTTKIVRRMIQIAYADPRKCMTWTSKSLKVKSSKDLTEEEAMMISEVKRLPDGTVTVKLHKPDAALRMLAQHFGMLQGETATPQTVTNNTTNTTVYVDAPPRETAEEWESRVRKQRGMKLVDRKVE
jgi:hypothetical protein